MCAHADSPERARIAVIGAGLSGATSARALTAAGHGVEVFDKGRGPGGRMSSRHVDRGAVDHGAPAFSPTSRSFREAVSVWQDASAVSPWYPSVARVRGEVLVPTVATEMYVGHPHMSYLVGHELGRVPLWSATRVTSVSRCARGWKVTTDSGCDHGSFDELVLALPAPQAVALPGVPSSISDPLRGVDFSPVWTALVQFSERVPARFDVLVFEEGPLDRAIRSGSKPGRTEDGWWTLRATSAWSRLHLENDSSSVVRVLMDALAGVSSERLPGISQATAHRWRYAHVVQPLESSFVRDPSLRITACGDFGKGAAGVEAAWLSGRSAARAILEAASPPVGNSP